MLIISFPAMRVQMMCLVGLQVPRAETFTIFALNAQGPGGRSAERLAGDVVKEGATTKVWKCLETRTHGGYNYSQFVVTSSDMLRQSGDTEDFFWVYLAHCFLFTEGNQRGYDFTSP